jgi:hypothetical protein
MRYARLVFVVSLIGIAFAAGRWVHAQPTVTTSVQLQMPRIISGGDLGFRVDGMKDDTVVGTLVIRVDGRWAEPEFSLGVKRLTAK